MAYGVLACPHCRRAQLVELRFESVSCRACRRRFDLRGRKLFHRSEDEAAARAALVKVSAQLQGMGVEDYSRLLAGLENERRGSLEDVAQSLSSREEFTAEEFMEEAARLRLAGDPERHLDRLRKENRVYEPRPGRFRFL